MSETVTLAHEAMAVAVERAKANRTGVMLPWDVATAIRDALASARADLDSLQAANAALSVSLEAARADFIAALGRTLRACQSSPAAHTDKQKEGENGGI